MPYIYPRPIGTPSETEESLYLTLSRRFFADEVKFSCSLRNDLTHTLAITMQLKVLDNGQDVYNVLQLELRNACHSNCF